LGVGAPPENSDALFEDAPAAEFGLVPSLVEKFGDPLQD